MRNEGLAFWSLKFETTIPPAISTAGLAGRMLLPLSATSALANLRRLSYPHETAKNPNAPRLDTAMIGRRDLDEIRGAARLERQRDIALQRRLVALDSEMIVRLLLDHIGG